MPRINLLALALFVHGLILLLASISILVIIHCLHVYLLLYVLFQTTAFARNKDYKSTTCHRAVQYDKH